MPRQKKDPRQCPQCGTIVKEPVKTWSLTSPLPDAYGRITVTVMGSFVCPNCGYRWRAVVSKLKVGGGDVEIEGAKGRAKAAPPARRSDEGEVIELDLESIMSEEE